ncbi:hypothetical protein SARC_02052 [Sphaeroforma arctica JP610]|uniref:Auxin efflux carrier n=1 Tax=Sphaeroforma arctica JP610 TaxID=667725 RepID=A0A0L0GA52_9EUKA|nr:hypothetical protein SARC_02052 [Sphaeroforma arctica JP610]KNC85789.1 hypothetical protein SARC_02052 [Sphaeroforma arctica JP610]|eukprot:XP_014159691.1 hypothetical protein SARC_02052 [Sphaeroforma arctica JP610]
MSDSLGETVINVLQICGAMYAIMLCGYISAAREIISVKGYEGIGAFIMGFSMPSMIYYAVATTNIYEIDLQLVLCVGVFTAMAMFLSFSMPALFNIVPFGGANNPKVSVLVWGVTFTNAVALNNALVMGVPVMVGMYGSDLEALQFVIVMLQVVFLFPIVFVLYEIDAVLNSDTGGQHNTPQRASTEKDKQVEASDTYLRQSKSDVTDTIDVAGTSEQFDLDQESEPQRRPSNVSILSERSSISVVANVIRSVITNKVIVAVIGGVAWSSIWNYFKPNEDMPLFLDMFFSWFADSVYGLSLFNVGYFMRMQSLVPPRNLLLQILFVLFLKFAVAPALMTVCAILSGLEGEKFKSIIIQSFIPSGTASFVFANHYNVKQEVVGPVVMWGSLLSLPAVLVGFFIVEAATDF